MRFYIISLCFIICIPINAQIEPFVDYNWTIEKIVTSDNTTIMADQQSDGSYDIMYIWYQDFIFEGYSYLISECEGFFDFNDIDQDFSIFGYSCAITTNHTIIADHFLNVFILEEGGLTETDNGPVYGPFSYDFSYSESGDIVYLHITNLAGSVASFYASTLGQEDFLKDSIAVYPNPALDVLHIETSGSAIDNVKIYDLNGRLVKASRINNNSQINVSQLQKGIYILNIETAVGVLKKKLVKK